MTNELLDKAADLAARCEAAEASEQRALLVEAFFALHPSPRFEPDWNCAGNAFRDWQDREFAFKRMIDAEAYESAAMTLVPEGWAYRVDMRPEGLDLPRGADTAPALGMVYRGIGQAHLAGAATPTLALCAAALRAREASTLARKRVLKWTQSRNGYTETHCGKYSIYPEYEGTTKPQSFRLWRNGNPRCNCGSHFNQRGAKDEAERLNAVGF